MWSQRRYTGQRRVRASQSTDMTQRSNFGVDVRQVRPLLLYLALDINDVT